MSAPAAPVEDYAATLAATLRGPERVRASMVREVRAGLHDAADALRATGLADEAAAERAVAEFGGVAELAPLFQVELTIAQLRRTSVLAMVAFPALFLVWDLVWIAAPADSGGLGGVELVVSRAIDVASVVVALVSAVLLALTRSRRVRPRAVAWAGALVTVLGVVSCAGGGIVLSVLGAASSPRVADLLDTTPVLVASLFSTAVVAVLLRSVTRTVRTAVRS